MEKQPLISIIVPVYNVERYLDRCIRSILEQSFRNLEILLIDDGSGDGSGAICDRYAEEDSRIRVVHKENGGLSDARNAGLDIMTGEYVVFIDSDDFVSSYYVENLYRSIAVSGCEAACSGWMMYYGRDPVPEGNIFSPQDLCILDREAFYRKMLYQDGVEILVCAKIYKSALFDGVRFPKGKLYEDVATTYRVIEKVSAVALIPNRDYYYFQRNEGISLSGFHPQKMDCIVHMSELRVFMETHYPALKPAARCRYFSAVCNILFLIDRGAYPKEKNILWQEIKRYRKGIILDKNGRRKARLGALLSYFGYEVMFFVYRHIEK